MSGVIIAGNKGNFAEVTDDGKLKVETAAELTLEAIELELQGTLDVDVTDRAGRALGHVTAELTGSNAASHESKTVDNTVGGVALTAGTYGTSIYALITAETAQMRFTVDGTAPTTTVGHLLNPGDTLKLDSLADITAFRAIRTGATSGVIKVTYSGVA